MAAICAAQCFLHFGVADVLAETGAPEIRDQTRRRGGAEVGGDQGFFQFLQRFVIQLAPGEDAGDVVGDFRRTALQPPM